MISRGSCPFAQKSALAGVAGAKAAIIYNNIAGPVSGTLGMYPRAEGPFVPTVGSTQAQGLEWRAAVEGGATLEAHVIVDAIFNSTYT